ncbi:hypothetical protein SAMN04487957_110138 [Halomonas shengliensis]|uniref:Uncharacterized protein n=1 Tax=Halomonas shengliensis TaxID=419597 RepID=A0A1H0LX60_9GAMM|nr:hypothetical protein [Halomonas shengliensis]SDO72673.1 hypothetical protein SAMN04487957_110138 [Halomonas shengliensis]
MAQATVLAAGTTAATSTDIVVAAGESVTVGIFSAAAAPVPAGAGFTVAQDTPGADNIVARLGQQQRATVLAGPGTYRVSRQAYTGEAFGVFTET